MILRDYRCDDHILLLHNFNCLYFLSSDVLPQINGSDFPIFHQTENFCDALVYMILHGHFAFQPTPTSPFHIPIGSTA